MSNPLEWLPYLHFGYLPPKEQLLPFSLPRERVQLPRRLPEAARFGGDVLSRAIHRHLEPGRFHYIPLSGGLDSRALLASALEAGVHIETLTFGTPGALDYEYGNRVARSAGTRHTILDLTGHLPDTAALVDTVRTGGGAWTYTFDAYFNRLLTRWLGTKPIVLHGYLGDPVAGAHYRPGLDDPAAARTAFAKSQRFSRNACLLPDSVEPTDFLPDVEIVPEVKGLTFYEALDFSVRQTGAIKPIVLDPNADMRTPFAASDWLSIMFSAPAEWRQGCKLYEAALLQRWPELFRLPTKNHNGLGLGAYPIKRTVRRIVRALDTRTRQFFGRASAARKAMLNYVDFDRLFTKSGLLHDLARENLADLADRGVVPWLNPEGFLDDHCDGKMTYSREIQLLVGLEINLKAQCASL